MNPIDAPTASRCPHQPARDLRRRAPLAVTLALVALVALSAGCEGATESDTGAAAGAGVDRFALAGPIQAAPQRAGDPELGRRALLSEPYVGCGLPLRVWEAAGGRESGPALPGREGPSADLPYFNTLVEPAGDVAQVAGNCLACHGAPLFGEIVIGLGNEFMDWTGDARVPVERAGALVRGAAETEAWERYADRIGAIAPHVRMRTVGSNPANNLTFALIAHRELDTHAWSDAPLLPLPTTEPPPVSVPPWWRMAKKHAMFNLGEGRGDHARIMLAASMLCTDSEAELEVVDAYAPDIRAYIASLEPPAWPFAIDAPLAERGRELFDARCADCHGGYGPDGSYPNLLVPIETVGTDPALLEQARRDGAPYIDWFNASWYGELATAMPGPGYVAPPLDGIWATAPYLHNGSVPSLAALLDSGTRPTLWRHLAPDGNDVEGYDPEAIGWRFAVPTADALDDLDDATRRRVFDTRLAGHGNGGHAFGDAFSPDERAAVLEYLKTL